MSDAPLDRELLVEIVTREVLATIAERSDICESPEKVRAVIANGADRVAYHGDASSVPLDLAKYIDIKEEISRLDREIVKLEKALIQDRKKLENPSFVERAPADKVEEVRARVAVASEKFTKLQSTRDELSS